MADFVNSRAETTSEDVIEAGLADDLHEASQRLNDLCRSGSYQPTPAWCVRPNRGEESTDEQEEIPSQASAS